MVKQIAFDIPFTWPYVREVRRVVGEALADVATVREAAIMTASELVENAVKYGERVASHKHIVFELSLTDSAIEIRVSNGVETSEDLSVLRTSIDLIRKTDDPEALYLRRLQELFDDPSDSGKLGLYRIRYEGQFSLDWVYTAPIVTVIATRDLAAA